jgi:hypothetical protein
MQAPAPIASTLPEPVLLREDAAGITVLTLNRPERRNSLSDRVARCPDRGLLRDRPG